MNNIIYLSLEWVENKLSSLYDLRKNERKKFGWKLPTSINKKHKRQNKYIDALERWRKQYKKEKNKSV